MPLSGSGPGKHEKFSHRMKQLFAYLLWSGLAIATFAGCNTDEEIAAGPLPEILLDNATGVYTVKAGRELRIAPAYRHAEGAAYRWTLDGKVCSEEAAYTFRSEATGSYDLDLRITTAAGTDQEQLRIDVATLTPPYITLPGAAEGFTVVQGEELHLSPVVAETLPVAYTWTVDGQTVADTRTYTFTRIEKGDYALSLTAANEDGTERLDFTVRVCSADELPFGWHFDRTEYSTTAGRTLLIRPAEVVNGAGAEFVWTLDGREVQRGPENSYLFRAETEVASATVHTLEAALLKQGHTLRQTLRITVNPPAAGYRPATASSKADCNAVYSFLPAPGQFVNEGYAVANRDEACAHALRSLSNPASYLSLGAFGGEVVVGFDHSIDCTGGYEIAVLGNPFDGSSEPGIVWVMQDENANGQPDDTWYELKGSEWGSAQVVRDYAVTYYRPAGPETDIAWRDNRGGEGVIGRLSFHTQESYYPLWADDGGVSYTLRGTLLPDNTYDRNAGTGDAAYWVLPGFAWGYADNHAATGYDRTVGNLFRISDAVDAEGRPAGLEYVDFVKVQTAQMAWHPQTGEVSTEVCAIRDYTLLSR